MITREDLAKLGFDVGGSDMEELWSSPRSPTGEWLVVRFEDMFGNQILQWERHTVLVAEVIDPPKDVVALMREMGIEVKP